MGAIKESLVARHKRGFAVRVLAGNHVRGSGNVVRWPRGFSCTLFVYQERSHDWSAESTHSRCLFCPVSGSFHGFIAWVVHTSKIRGRRRAKCTEKQRVSKHAESSLSAWFTYVVQNRTTVLILKCGPVQRVSRAETRTAKPLYWPAPSVQCTRLSSGNPQNWSAKVHIAFPWKVVVFGLGWG